MSMEAEKYYAIKIGKRPKNKPYLMIGTGSTPMLFEKNEMGRSQAELLCKNQPDFKIVIVKIIYK